MPRLTIKKQPPCERRYRLRKPGDALAWLSCRWLGFTALGCGSCNQHRQRMNMWGWRRCWRERKKIYGWLAKEMGKREIKTKPRAWSLAWAVLVHKTPNDERNQAAHEK